MSFISATNNGVVYAPGYFLASADEEAVRETREIPSTGDLVTTTADGAKYVKAGTVYPSNDGNAIGIVYEDVDVTNGNMPGSVVTKGNVYTGRLAVEIAGAAKTALVAAGFKFIDSEPDVTRPY